MFHINRLNILFVDADVLAAVNASTPIVLRHTESPAVSQVLLIPYYISNTEKLIRCSLMNGPKHVQFAHVEGSEWVLSETADRIGGGVSKTAISELVAQAGTAPATTLAPPACAEIKPYHLQHNENIQPKNVQSQEFDISPLWMRIRNFFRI